MTRRMVLAGVVMGVVLFAGRIAPVGRAWDEERQCGKAGDGNGALTPNLRWETRDPQRGRLLVRLAPMSSRRPTVTRL
jgi:hypothetical protein